MGSYFRILAGVGRGSVTNLSSGPALSTNDPTIFNSGQEPRYTHRGAGVTLTGLNIRIGTNTASLARTFRLDRVSPSAATLYSISLPANTTGTFSATADVAVSDGDVLETVVPSVSSTGAHTYGSATISFSTDDGVRPLYPMAAVWGLTNITIASATRIIRIAGLMNYATTTERDYPIQSSGVLKGSYARVSANGRSSVLTCNIRKNGSNVLPISVPGLATGYFETIDDVTVAVGDTVGGSFTTGTGTQTINLVFMGAHFQSDVENEILFPSGNAGSIWSGVTGPWFGPIGGRALFASGATNEANLSFAAPMDCLLKDAHVRVIQNGAGVSTLRTRKNGADGAISISIPASTTGTFTSTDTEAVTTGDLLCWAFTARGSTSLNPFPSVVMTTVGPVASTYDDDVALGAAIAVAIGPFLSLNAASALGVMCSAGGGSTLSAAAAISAATHAGAMLQAAHDAACDASLVASAGSTASSSATAEQAVDLASAFAVDASLGGESFSDAVTVAAALGLVGSGALHVPGQVTLQSRPGVTGAGALQMVSAATIGALPGAGASALATMGGVAALAGVLGATAAGAGVFASVAQVGHEIGVSGAALQSVAAAVSFATAAAETSRGAITMQAAMAAALQAGFTAQGPITAQSAAAMAVYLSQAGVASWPPIELAVSIATSHALMAVHQLDAHAQAPFEITSAALAETNSASNSAAALGAAIHAVARGLLEISAGTGLYFSVGSVPGAALTINGVVTLPASIVAGAESSADYGPAIEFQATFDQAAAGTLDVHEAAILAAAFTVESVYRISPKTAIALSGQLVREISLDAVIGRSAELSGKIEVAHALKGLLDQSRDLAGTMRLVIGLRGRLRE